MQTSKTGGRSVIATVILPLTKQVSVLWIGRRCGLIRENIFAVSMFVVEVAGHDSEAQIRVSPNFHSEFSIFASSRPTAIFFNICAKHGLFFVYFRLFLNTMTKFE